MPGTEPSASPQETWCSTAPNFLQSQIVTTRKETNLLISSCK
uniref:Uncharacterized protein n=1 Tax=Arundo donax TaxID=35708 RepID=A0A0A9G5D4_ARUDO